MEYLLKTTYFTGQKSILTKSGDDFWEQMCADFDVDEHFTRKDVIEMLKKHFGYADSSAQSIAYALVANLLAMEEGGLFEVTKKYLRFHDTNGR